MHFSLDLGIESCGHRYFWYDMTGVILVAGDEVNDVIWRDHIDILVPPVQVSNGVTTTDQHRLRVERLPIMFQSTSVQDVANILALKLQVEEPAQYGLFILVTTTAEPESLLQGVYTNQV